MVLASRRQAVLPHRGFAAPFTLPSLVCGLLLRVRLALRRHQFRFRHLAFTADLRRRDLLPDLHAAADDRQRYGAVSSQLADSPHRP